MLYPGKKMNPAQTLLSPPPEETIRRNEGLRSTSRQVSRTTSTTSVVLAQLASTTTVISSQRTPAKPASKRKRSTAVAVPPMAASVDPGAGEDSMDEDSTPSRPSTSTGYFAPHAETMDMADQTPNPKARKQTRRHTRTSLIEADQDGTPTKSRISPRASSSKQPSESPTKGSRTPSKKKPIQSPHKANPEADFIPPVPEHTREYLSMRQRSITPGPAYEPPTDQFTPPRVVYLHPTASMSTRKPSARASSITSTTASTRGISRGGSKSISVAKLPPGLFIKTSPPKIDLSGPLPPGSPTDDPLLLTGSSRPRAKRKSKGRTGSSSSRLPSSNARDSGSNTRHSAETIDSSPGEFAVYHSRSSPAPSRSSPSPAPLKGSHNPRVLLHEHYEDYNIVMPDVSSSSAGADLQVVFEDQREESFQVEDQTPYEEYNAVDLESPTDVDMSDESVGLDDFANAVYRRRSNERNVVDEIVDQDLNDSVDMEIDDRTHLLDAHMDFPPSSDVPYLEEDPAPHEVLVYSDEEELHPGYVQEGMETHEQEDRDNVHDDVDVHIDIGWSSEPHYPFADGNHPFNQQISSEQDTSSPVQSKHSENLILDETGYNESAGTDDEEGWGPSNANGGGWASSDSDDGNTGDYTDKYTTMSVAVKADPPTSGTKSRMDRWGRPRSPFPYPGGVSFIGEEEEGEEEEEKEAEEGRDQLDEEPEQYQEMQTPSRESDRTSLGRRESVEASAPPPVEQSPLRSLPRSTSAHSSSETYVEPAIPESPPKAAESDVHSSTFASPTNRNPTLRSPFDFGRPEDEDQAQEASLEDEALQDYEMGITVSVDETEAASPDDNPIQSFTPSHSVQQRLLSPVSSPSSFGSPKAASTPSSSRSQSFTVHFSTVKREILDESLEVCEGEDLAGEGLGFNVSRERSIEEEEMEEEEHVHRELSREVDSDEEHLRASDVEQDDAETEGEGAGDEGSEEEEGDTELPTVTPKRCFSPPTGAPFSRHDNSVALARTIPRRSSLEDPPQPIVSGSRLAQIHAPRRSTIPSPHHTPLQAQQVDDITVDVEDEDPTSSDEEIDLGVVKITSGDPRAAARAAAILKMHDYDCLPREELKSRRHSSAYGMDSLSRTARRRGATASGISKRTLPGASPFNDAHRRRTIAATKRSGLAASYTPGAPAMTLPDLLREAEADVSVSFGYSPATGHASEEFIDTRNMFETPGIRRTLDFDASPLGLNQAREDHSVIRSSGEWTKDDWKRLDACFTDERLELGGGEDLADVDKVVLSNVVARFVGYMGGAEVVEDLGPSWDQEILVKRAQALQTKQRSGNVAPPTPSFTQRQASMEMPNFTPLPRLFRGHGKLAASPLSNEAPFQQLSVERPRLKVPPSLLGPQYGHLLDEALAVSPRRDAPSESAEEAPVEAEASDSALKAAEVPKPPPPVTAPQLSPTLGNRVKGFLYSYLSTMSRKPSPQERLRKPAQPGFPLPSPSVIKKVRKPIATPARPPIQKARPAKDSVSLHPVTPQTKPTTRIPRATARLVELHPVPEDPPPPVPRSALNIPKGRRSSGASVKDLVNAFQEIGEQNARERELELARPKSRAGVLKVKGKTPVKPIWK